MAAITLEVGNASFEMKRSSTATWDIYFQNDEAFGPVLLLQKGIQVIRITDITEEDLDAMIEWAHNQ
jgi:hypothetical protein